MAETFPNRVGDFMLDLRVLIPMSPSYLGSAIRVFLRSVGLREQKGKQDHRVCFAKRLQLSLQAWVPAPCRDGTFNLLRPR